MEANTQPRLPEVEHFITKVQFLKFMKTLDTFDYVYKEADGDNIREKLDKLRAGKHLLEDEQAITLCEDLIVRYRYFLHGDPDELVKEHESFLREHLAVDAS